MFGDLDGDGKINPDPAIAQDVDSRKRDGLLSIRTGDERFASSGRYARAELYLQWEGATGLS